jgi:hypothetical protein
MQRRRMRSPIYFDADMGKLRKGSGLDGLLLKKDELVAKFRQVTLSG